jgi:predicted RNA-binding protein YlxR (DUF448 family)
VSGPIRTCVGCRQAAPAAALVRLALRAGRFVTVVGRVRPAGRGAWLHAREACLRGAVKTRAFDRAFRTAVAPPDVDQLWAELAAATQAAMHTIR